MPDLAAQLVYQTQTTPSPSSVPPPASGPAPNPNPQTGSKDVSARAQAPEPARLAARYREVRADSQALCETLESEDYVIQSMDDVSPTKWHLAHTSWFFETFLLREQSGYREFQPEYEFLFNSYYNAVGPQFHRPHRGLLSRPTVAQVYAYRKHVDEHMQRLLETHLSEASLSADQPGQLEPGRAQQLRERVILGLHHEQQHQELMLMDIKHVFWTNPLRPALRPEAAAPSPHPAPALTWFRGPEGQREIGYQGGHPSAGFCYDNETPRHTVFLAPFELASRCVTNGEYLAFIEDDGYRRCEFWLSDGWATVQAEGWHAPLYWEQRGSEWYEMTLGGMKPLDPHAPVVHVSHYEADAYARWAGARLPTEAEWEAVAAQVPQAEIDRGHFTDLGRLHPSVAPASPTDPSAAPSTGPSVAPSTNPSTGPSADPNPNHAPAGLPTQLFGDVWEWTASAYLPYPGYQPAAGAIGEYNGKFMSGQMVLRGGACVTPTHHIRATYRNFFPARSRWPFSGIRLARNL